MEDPWQKPDFANGFLMKTSSDSIYLLVRNPVDTSLIYGNYSFPIQQEENDRFGVLSTTYLSFFNLLHAEEMVAGAGHINLIRSDVFRQKIQEGTLVEISGESVLDVEKLAASGSNVLLSYPGGVKNEEIIGSLNIKVINLVEHLEPHPLGRAEWIKVFGILCNQQTKSSEIFENIKKSYENTVLEIPKAGNTPAVFFGSSFQGVWYAPPGNSFMAKLIEDAGGKYIFSDKIASGNLTMDFEKILMTAESSDWWGTVVSIPADKDIASELLSTESRYRELKPFKTGKVFYCNSANSDYFEKGVIEPHLLLQDLVKIFHPEFSNDSSEHYFHVLEKE